MKDALIIFVRNPVSGKIKTRLAATIGNEKALQVYEILLQHTHSITKYLPLTKFIYYDNHINENDLWNDGYEKKLQQGNDLGERMHNSFLEVMPKGFSKICIIGSDCFELNAQIISNAFEELKTNDIVIGPATDGGYYLLGMKGRVPNLFDNIKWSSNNVYEETVKLIKQINLTFAALPVLSDVDEENDITFVY